MNGKSCKVSFQIRKLCSYSIQFTLYNFPFCYSIKPKAIVKLDSKNIQQSKFLIDYSIAPILLTVTAFK